MQAELEMILEKTRNNATSRPKSKNEVLEFIPRSLSPLMQPCMPIVEVEERKNKVVNPNSLPIKCQKITFLLVVKIRSFPCHIAPKAVSACALCVGEWEVRDILLPVGEIQGIVVKDMASCKFVLAEYLPRKAVVDSSARGIW